MPWLPRASAPASRAGRNGLTPLAPERPAPSPMSTKREMVGAVRWGGAMTIDDDLGRGRDASRGREVRPMSRARSTKRDLERYSELFASRTRATTSSAMRDLMAIIARPEVISLAGGLPDTGAFPSQAFADMAAAVAEGSAAQALQYGPTEGMARTRECTCEVMAAEGIRADPDDMIVTSGGRQVIDLVTRVLIDPGDVIGVEA